MAERIGKHTILLPTKPSVYGFASVVGKAESEGPLSQEFDKAYDDDTIDGCPTWEKSESELQKEAIKYAKSICVRKIF